MLNKSVKIKNEGNQIKKVKVFVPGSCGELFQGQIGNDRLLISCPIAKYSNVNYLYRTKIISGGIKIEKKE